MTENIKYFIIISLLLSCFNSKIKKTKGEYNVIFENHKFSSYILSVYFVETGKNYYTDSSYFLFKLYNKEAKLIKEQLSYSSSGGCGTTSIFSCCYKDSLFESKYLIAKNVCAIGYGDEGGVWGAHVFSIYENGKTNLMSVSGDEGTFVNFDKSYIVTQNRNYVMFDNWNKEPEFHKIYKFYDFVSKKKELEFNIEDIFDKIYSLKTTTKDKTKNIDFLDSLYLLNND